MTKKGSKGESFIDNAKTREFTDYTTREESSNDNKNDKEKKNN